MHAATELTSIPSDAVSASMRAALSRGSQAALILLLITTLVITIHTHLRRWPLTCMLVMHDATVTATAVLTGFLALLVTCFGWHSARAGDLVCAFTLLSALDFLPQHARINAWRAMKAGLQGQQRRRPDGAIGDGNSADLLSPRTTSSPSLSSSHASSHPSPASTPPPTADQRAVPGITAPPPSVKSVWPIRHSIDGCLLAPHPLRHSDPQITDVPVAVCQTLAPQSMTPSAPQFPHGVVHEYATGVACGMIRAHVPHAPPAESQHTACPTQPARRRWSLDDPMRWSLGTKLPHWPPHAWAEDVSGARECVPDPQGVVVEAAGAAPPGVEWFEALAANALVLDSLEPLNPRCAVAVSKLRGIGLHACNPLMHELHRRPSSTAADALQRFGLPRPGTARAASMNTGAAASPGCVPEGLAVDPVRQVVPVALGGGGWLQGATSGTNVRHAGAAGRCESMCGVHACVRIMAAAATALIWQSIAAVFWAAAITSAAGAEDLDDADAAEVAAACAVHEASGSAGLSSRWLDCRRAASHGHAVFSFFLFFKVWPLVYHCTCSIACMPTWVPIGWTLIRMCQGCAGMPCCPPSLAEPVAQEFSGLCR